MRSPPTRRLLRYARELQRAGTFLDLLEITRDELRATLGYEKAWLFVTDPDDLDQLVLIDAAGDNRDEVWANAPRLTPRGDAMLEEILASDAPVVVEDAQTDPRTDKRIVEQLGNRTIVNVPLRLLDRPFGALGTGTFGDEGVRVPTNAQLDYLVGMASQLSVAASRIRYLEERERAERDRREYERRLVQLQRLESVGLLADGIAHDFNNLLSVVLSGAELALAAPSEERREEALRAVMAAGTRAAELTRQLLAMSRGQELTLHPVDLNDRLRQLVGLLRPIFPRDVEVRLLLADALPTVSADASQLDQVLMNLCINARDAMPSGGTLTLATSLVTHDEAWVATHPGSGLGDHVRVVVDDTGVGMPPEVLDHAFEPFFTTKGSHGTGLGLAVAFGIVRQHGGMLSCTSEVGRGTRFVIDLPVTG